MTVRTDLLIVGAGPTGLGAAWRLDQRAHADWLMIEATDHAGGLASSVVDEHGFTWDLGGHVQFSHYQYFDDLMDELLGIDGWHYHDRESWGWVRNRFVPYPFQLNVHRLPEDDAVRAIAGLVHAARQTADPPRHFGEWIDQTFGPGIADIFMRPYNSKVWARDPSRMAWDWIGDRVAVVDLPRVVENLRRHRDDVSWGPNNRFRFPRLGGTGAIWQALANKLSIRHGSRMHFGRALISVDTAAHVARFSDGSEVRYERLLSTMALDQFVRLSDLDSEYRDTLTDLEYSTTHVIGIGLHGQAPESIARKCWMYFPEDNCPFYRVTHFSRYSPANVPDASRHWSLMAEVSESPFRPLRRPDLVEDTIDGLLATGLVADRSLVHHAWCCRLERGYPIPSLHRDRALDRLFPAFAERDVRSRGRFGAWKYEVSNQDHSFAQGVEAVDAWLSGEEEETLNTPQRVNARRPVRSAVGRI